MPLSNTPAPTDAASPRAEYDDRLVKRRAALEALERRDARIADLRLACFLAALGLLAAGLLTEAVSAWWALAPAALFLALVVWHEVVIARARRVAEAVSYFERGVARLEHRWQGSGVERTDFVGAEHPYAADLDLFGRGSLFELLCTARTRAGEELLARWLTRPSQVAELAERHPALLQLRPRVDLREELSVAAGSVRSEVHPEILVRWAEAPAVFGRRARPLLYMTAWLLAAGAVVTLGLWAIGLGPLPFFCVVGLELAVRRLLRGRIGRVLAGLDQPERELGLLARVLTRLEQEPLDSGRLRELARMLAAGDTRASRAIRSLRRVVAWLEAQRNQIFAPFAFLLMWSLHFTLAVESWRRRHGPAVARWLDALGELEALCALAGYAYEHPEDPLPELVPDGAALFEGEGLGHPLLAPESCVRNDVRLGGDERVWIVSGSNMSGKSTLLRTVGVNTVLAMAGGPVRARRLRLSPLSCGATIRIQDSLLAGTSRFYAEVQRLGQLMRLAGGEPALLFLLDEILHGTNSHDRRIGAAALIQRLVEAGAVGLVTTHDLAVAEVAGALGEAGRNVHFADQVEDGRLVFDYCVRPGVVQHSNALELMRSVGLPV